MAGATEPDLALRLVTVIKEKIAPPPPMGLAVCVTYRQAHHPGMY